MVSQNPEYKEADQPAAGLQAQLRLIPFSSNDLVLIKVEKRQKIKLRTCTVVRCFLFFQGVNKNFSWGAWRAKKARLNAVSGDFRIITG
ncbi:MAG TPA: hypothetical protein VGE15_02250 [Sphingobacteriaceae bacterium]